MTASSLADLLDEAEPTPRLVVLNSCQSGAAGTIDLFSGTAAALAHSGIRAVAAMQFAISDVAALEFSRGFYTALAHGRGIDEAVRSGRIGILGIGRGTLEWVTPVLYLRGKDKQLFNMAPMPVSPQRAAPLTPTAAGAGGLAGVVGAATGTAPSRIPGPIAGPIPIVHTGPVPDVAPPAAATPRPGGGGACRAADSERERSRCNERHRGDSRAPAAAQTTTPAPQAAPDTHAATTAAERDGSAIPDGHPAACRSDALPGASTGTRPSLEAVGVVVVAVVARDRRRRAGAAIGGRSGDGTAGSPTPASFGDSDRTHHGRGRRQLDRHRRRRGPRPRSRPGPRHHGRRADGRVLDSDRSVVRSRRRTRHHGERPGEPRRVVGRRTRRTDRRRAPGGTGRGLREREHRVGHRDFPDHDLGFGVGAGTRQTCEFGGHLYLGINDQNLVGNRGAFDAVITRIRPGE